MLRAQAMTETKIKLDKKLVTNKFLSPISKLADKCSMTILPDSIYTIIDNNDAGYPILLYANIACKNNVKKSLKLNIGDSKRLLNVLKCVDEEMIDLEIDSNSLSYSSPAMKFKYHLLDDGVIDSAPATTEKINNLQFDCNFEIQGEKILEVLKGASFSAESDKIYFFVKDDKVFVELTDKTLSNTDSLTLHIADSYTGTQLKESIPLKLEIFRMFLGLKFDKLLVKINTKLKVLMFEIVNDGLTLKYIVSALVK